MTSASDVLHTSITPQLPVLSCPSRRLYDLATTFCILATTGEPTPWTLLALLYVAFAKKSVIMIGLFMISEVIIESLLAGSPALYALCLQ